MSTVNFSVPADIKADFDAAFAGRNKSAVIAGLMREAVERAARERSHRLAVHRILRRRARSKPVSEDRFTAAREADRP